MTSDLHPAPPTGGKGRAGQAEEVDDGGGGGEEGGGAAVGDGEGLRGSRAVLREPS